MGLIVISHHVFCSHFRIRCWWRLNVVGRFTQFSGSTFGHSHTWRMVPWQKVMLPYLPGALIGGVLGYFALGRFSVAFLPIILGVFILLVTWTQWVQRFGMWLHNMSLLGGVQTFFALFVGTLGWLSAPILLQKGLKKDQVIVTQSAIMGLMNTLKVIVFVAAGFAYLQHSALILIMLVGALFGNLLGACFAHSD